MRFFPPTVFLIAVAVHAGPLSFDSEKIIVRLVALDTIEVSGTYVFSHSARKPRTYPVFYPFPVDSTMMYPCSVSVAQGDSAVEFTAHKRGNGIRIPAAFERGQAACTLTVFYRQHVESGKGRYILTTTSRWNKPLRHAAFEVQIPAGMLLTYMSYKCDSTVRTDSITTHHFQRKNFQPERDLDLSWRRIPSSGRRY
ncbi:MAG: DUF4424 domain-containing protein [Chitinivibrionales bacterium]|nr:DUF4424 domain-containing protein [Chitinivibrionales bacterium]